MASALVRRNINNLKRLSCWRLNNNNKQLLNNVEDDACTVSIHTEAVGVGVGLPSYMRGAVFREPNKPLTIEEFHIPRPKAGELLIKTKGPCLHFFILSLSSLYILFNFYIQYDSDPKTCTACFNLP